MHTNVVHMLGVVVVIWHTQFVSVCVQLRRVVNQTKGGKKRSMRALVVIGNKDGAAGMYVWDEGSLVSLSALLPLPLPLPPAVSASHTQRTYVRKCCMPLSCLMQGFAIGKGQDAKTAIRKVRTSSLGNISS